MITTRASRPSHQSALRSRAVRAPRLLLVVGTLAALGAAACSGRRGPSESQYETTVRTPPDSTLRIARTQLQLHAFEVTPAGENALVTAPRPVPTHLQSGESSLKGRHWMLRVEAERRALAGGSRMRVLGYLLPPPSTNPRATGPTSKQATVITSDQPQLFAEVRAAGRWIEDAAGRSKR
jgi:hypothetical protein